MPDPCCNSCVISCFVDADHAGNVVTWHSQTGIIILLNNTLAVWFSKHQNTVEASTSGSDFNALQIAVDLIVALWFKLGMLGVRVDSAASGKLTALLVSFVIIKALFSTPLCQSQLFRRSTIRFVTIVSVKLSLWVSFG
jgi:hypothetical protein